MGSFASDAEQRQEQLEWNQNKENAERVVKEF